jgi:hypothetical protein
MDADKRVTLISNFSSFGGFDVFERCRKELLYCREIKIQNAMWIEFVLGTQ